MSAALTEKLMKTIMLLRELVVTALIIAISIPVYAQSSAIAGDLIVRLREGEQVEALLGAGRSSNWTLRYRRPLGRLHNIHLVATEPGREAEALRWLQGRREVMAAQLSYAVDFRTTPNDPLYSSQWTLEHIGAPEIWSVTTGGLSSRGDTIVVAILDNGFDASHPDLAPNLWRNRLEIPGDGLDNDGNGYSDDVNGWNFVANSPTYNISSGHGHSVAGIIGARGDNDTGVAGINWNVKLMLLNISEVPQIIEAYEYVIEQRRLYNQTRGAQGAFIVATNASFGQGRIYCEQQPVWAGMYDLMGAEGVLTGAGTDNSRYDVDELGDMPATCPSEYLIVTLNTTEADDISQTSAYGRVSIDLGAPGDDSFTTKPNENYGTFGGNSAAAPHVTGAIALLYSLPCEALGQDALDSPAATARFIRRAILQGVTPATRLNNRTVTGGRLNLLGSMEVVQQECGTTTGPLEVVKLYPNPADGDRIYIEFEAPDFEVFTVEVFDALGRQLYVAPIRAPRFGLKRYELPVGQLPTGPYFLRLTKGEETVVKKIVVNR